MKNSLVWFRNDLRVTDNNSLINAASNADSLIAVYCFDPRTYEQTQFGFNKTGKFRAQFTRETVAELKKNLKDLNIPLFIYFEKPESVIPTLVTEYDITDIFSQKEWTSEEIIVDQNIASDLADDIAWHAQYDQFLFHPEDIPYDSFQNIPEVFTQFRKKCEKYSKIRATVDIPQNIPVSNYFESNTLMPSLEDLGLTQFTRDKRSVFQFNGGEQAALDRLYQYFWETASLKKYKETRNGLIGTDYSSKFSPWLSNGSISARKIYQEVKRFEKTVHKNSSTYWMIFELIWRDYFKYVSLKHGNAIFQLDGILNKSYDWQQNTDHLDNWINGNTTYDFVNANMKELAATGWMSNRGRQNVASYWAKEIEQDWRIGASYFESMLIDYDVHSNWGNWMYNAGVGNDPRDRKFNIARQASMYDPDNEYVNLWLE